MQSGATTASLGAVWRLVPLLLRHPQAGWGEVARLAATPGLLMAGLAAPLAAVGTFAAVIGASVVGIPTADGGMEKTPVEQGLIWAGGSYVLTMASVWVMALLIEALAPRFEARCDRLAAVKLAVYSSTPSWIAAMAFAFPPLAWLSVLGLYALYLFWTGVPALAPPPRDKQPAFALSVMGLMFLLSVVTAVASGGL